jgi:hypothetical protein
LEVGLQTTEHRYGPQLEQSGAVLWNRVVTNSSLPNVASGTSIKQISDITPNKAPSCRAVNEQLIEKMWNKTFVA